MSFMKSVSVKCCHVWLFNPDLWFQRGRVVLWLRHKTASSGSSWFCWRLPCVTVGRTFLPAPQGKWTSACFKQMGTVSCFVATQCPSWTLAEQGSAHQSCWACWHEVVCMVYKHSPCSCSPLLCFRSFVVMTEITEVGYHEHHLP